MIYTISETNLERQHLLAQFLNPITSKSLQNISLPKEAAILDVGCGLGDTTLMLLEHFPGSSVIGLDGDGALIEAATRENCMLDSNLEFVCADALGLPFDDNRFDLVFTRCCLHHLPSAMDGLMEMKRVCKTGGFVFAQEPDINSIISYPESWVYQKHKEYLNMLAADAILGRKLISYFRRIRLQCIGHHVESVIGDETNQVKKFLSMTGSAIGNALIKNKLATSEEHHVFVQELIRSQYDPEIIVIMAPSIAVWGIK